MSRCTGILVSGVASSPYRSWAREGAQESGFEDDDEDEDEGAESGLLSPTLSSIGGEGEEASTFRL